MKARKLLVKTIVKARGLKYEPFGFECDIKGDIEDIADAVPQALALMAMRCALRCSDREGVMREIAYMIDPEEFGPAFDEWLDGRAPTEKGGVIVGDMFKVDTDG